jgi:hypothetical protein
MTPRQCFAALARIPDPLAHLPVLAENITSLRSASARALFDRFETDALHAADGNLCAALAQVEPARLAELACDDAFLGQLDAATAEHVRYLSGVDTWYMRTFRSAPRPLAAYVSSDLFQSEWLDSQPAHDRPTLMQMASDLGVPLVGVGVLPAQYVESAADAARLAAASPFTLVCDDQGAPVGIEVELPDRTIPLRIWRGQVGRCPMLLLAAACGNDVFSADNDASEKQRLEAAFVHQVGAARALEKLRLDPPIWYVDRIAPVFGGLARIAHLMRTRRASFALAAEVVAGTVLTAPANSFVDSPSFAGISAGYARELGVSTNELRELAVLLSSDAVALPDRGDADAVGVLRRIVSRSYIPRAYRYARAQMDAFALALRSATHRVRVMSAWDETRIFDVTPEVPLRLPTGSFIDIRAVVQTPLDAHDVRPEAVYGTVDEDGEITNSILQPLTYVSGSKDGFVYMTRVRVPENPGLHGYTLQLRPNFLAPWCHVGIKNATGDST